MIRDERGAAATEWVLLAPAVVLILGVLVAGGRLAWARAGVADAAHAAARAASVQRDVWAAQAVGREVGLANLDGVCPGGAVVLDTSGFALPVGTAARVTATVSCRVGLADLLVPGLPGGIDVSADGIAVLDSFRGRR